VFPLLTQQAPLTQLNPLGQQVLAPEEETQTWPLGQQLIPTQTSPLGQQPPLQTWSVGQQAPNPTHVSPLGQQTEPPIPLQTWLLEQQPLAVQV
jgi:hypothetical protein